MYVNMEVRGRDRGQDMGHLLGLPVCIASPHPTQPLHSNMRLLDPLPAALQDYVSRSSGRPNDQFQRIMQLFRQRCGARLHWGKAGWPQHAKCFKGSIEYPSTWCSFGCAVQVGVWVALCGGVVVVPKTG